MSVGQVAGTQKEVIFGCQEYRSPIFNHREFYSPKSAFPGLTLKNHREYMLTRLEPDLKKIPGHAKTKDNPKCFVDIWAKKFEKYPGPSHSSNKMISWEK
jgi:hypothetical protein